MGRREETLSIKVNLILVILNISNISETLSQRKVTKQMQQKARVSMSEKQKLLFRHRHYFRQLKYY